MSTLPVLLVVLFAVYSSPAIAQKNGLIPVVGEATMEFDLSNPSEKKAFESFVNHKAAGFAINADSKKGTVTTNTKIGESSSSDISRIAKSLRTDVCSALSKGDNLKFTINWDASAKVWGVGVSGNSGIEVQIKC